MKRTATPNALKPVLVTIAALACFALIVIFSTRDPGSAQTAFADTNTTLVASPSQNSVSILEQMQKANREISSLILPAVVTLDIIETKKVSDSLLDGSPWFFFGDPSPKADSEDKKPQEREYKSEGLGSGVIIRKINTTYYLLTNHHVAGSANEIEVKLFDGRSFTGKLIGGDERKDIALVSFESDDSSIPVAVMGNSETVQTGDIVYAVGSPLGYMSSVTQGIVSAVGRSGGPNNNINDFIQTDAAINQGNSGGPLINIYGQVIGINSWIASSTGGSQGLGFSIPINNVKKAIDDFISSGKIKYGWLGVSLLEADKLVLSELGIIGKKGALASQVFIGSPAQKGGFLSGDFVISLNGKDVQSVNQLVRDVGDLPVGAKAVFKVIRNKKEVTLTVTIDERNEKTIADASKLWPGFVTYPISEEARKQLKLEDSVKGVIIASVQSKSPASVMGLLSGDVITHVNDKAIQNLNEFYTRLADKSLKEIWFDVVREGQKLSTIRYKL